MTWLRWLGTPTGSRFALRARLADVPGRAQRRAASLRGWEECEPRTLLTALPMNAGAHGVAMPGTLAAATLAAVDNSTDTDGDGVGDAVEAAGPNGGDANRDGVPDVGQSDVATFPNAVDGRYISIQAQDGASFSGAHAVAPPAGAPAGLQFPYGLVGFTLHVPRPGAVAEVLVVLPDAVSAESYANFGPTTGTPTPHWYQLPFDQGNGAASGPGVVMFRVADGLRGDDDLKANGLVVETGGPAMSASQADLVVTARPPATSASAGGPLTYTLTVTNAGTKAATGVVLAGALPAGATLGKVVVSQGTFRVAGGMLSAQVGNLAPGARATVSVTVTPRSAGTLAVSARARADQVEPDDANNTARLAIRVAAAEAPGPRLVRVQQLGSRLQPSRLLLTFDRALSPSTAVLAANYRLTDAGRDGQIGSRDDRPLAFRSVSYNAASRTVTIVTAGPLDPRRMYRLVVNGTSARALADASGHRLDGDGNGRAGGDAVALIRMSTTATVVRSHA